MKPMAAARPRGTAMPPGTGGVPAVWQKIFIMGPPASGKSFWAQRVSEATGIRWYELDEWFLKDENDPERTRWQKSLLTLDSWIVEGIYPWAEAMAQADAVLVLRPPWWVRDFRIVWHRYVWPGVSKVGRTAWRIAVTLRTSHAYAGDQEVRMAASAKGLGIQVVEVPTGERLMAQVLSHVPSDAMWHATATGDTGPPRPTRA